MTDRIAETIYVVVGTTGEYSDLSERMVCAYRDEGMARTHAEVCNREAERCALKMVRWAG